MAVEIRPATLGDLPEMVALLLDDARSREARDPILWALAGDASEQVEKAVRFALTAEDQPFRQMWYVAEVPGKMIGIIHSALLPVPPIYAGLWGDPGLVMPECFVTPDAPSGTIEALVDAAEAGLRDAGARLLLASFVSGEDWRSCFEARGYRPLTLYLARTGLDAKATPVGVRPASKDDLEAIVERSAANRAILSSLDVFWTPHANANSRFARWMERSLALPERDMLVMSPAGHLEGYVIAQPAARLHFPPAHDITATGVIDDFFHDGFADPAGTPEAGARAAIRLLQGAEAAFSARGIGSALVVCPAAWTSKIAILESAGYRTALVWMIKR
ncbi:MAG: hypothetical protein ABWY78_14620 [Microvirga sp.]